MVSDLISDLHLTVLTDVYQDRAVLTGYCCDMLSWVMAHLSESACWFTILNSVNVIAVASLSGCPCVVLTEKVMMDDSVLARARDEKICVCMSESATYEAAGALAESLRKHGRQ